MTDVGRFMIIGGLVLAAVGGVVWLLGRAGFRGMPGDVAYEGSNVRVYFPVVTCIVVSVLLTLGIWLWRWISSR